MRYGRIIPCLLVAGFLAGCSSAVTEESDSRTLAVAQTLPPDDDVTDSQKSAAEFRKASWDDAAVYELLPAVDRIIGDWEDGQGRAFISTELPVALSTSRNGELLAGAFAAWKKSESGNMPVSVYGGDGKLIHTGTF